MNIPPQNTKKLSKSNNNAKRKSNISSYYFLHTISAISFFIFHLRKWNTLIISFNIFIFWFSFIFLKTIYALLIQKTKTDIPIIYNSCNVWISTIYPVPWCRAVLSLLEWHQQAQADPSQTKPKQAIKESQSREPDECSLTLLLPLVYEVLLSFLM